jgi:hypothetical protein
MRGPPRRGFAMLIFRMLTDESLFGKCTCGSLSGDFYVFDRPLIA